MKKLETTITIAKPAKVIWDYMSEPENMPKWLNDVEKYEHISGETGEVGARARMHYNENGRKFTMDEEILEQKKYEYIKLGLNSKSLDMIIENRYKSIDDNTTELTSSAEFTRASLGMKLMMTLFMPHSKAQAQNDEQMNRLKELVEKS